MRKLIFLLLTSIMLMSVSLAFPVFSTSATVNFTSITNQDQDKEFMQVEYRSYKIPSGNSLTIDLERILAYQKIEIMFGEAKTVEGTPRSITLSTANIQYLLSNAQVHTTALYTSGTPITEPVTQWLRLTIQNNVSTCDLMVTLNINVIKDRNIITGNISATLTGSGNDVNMYAKSSDGVARTVTVDFNGALSVIQRPVILNSYSSSLTQNNSWISGNVKTAPGTVLRIIIQSNVAAARYFQIFDQTGAVSAGQTPLYKFYVANGANLVLGPGDLGINGLYCSKGIAIGASTSRSTFTAGASTDMFIDLEYL